MDVFGVCLSTFLLAKRVWSEWHSKWSGAISLHAEWLGLAPEALAPVGRQSQMPGQALLFQRCPAEPHPSHPEHWAVPLCPASPGDTQHGRVAVGAEPCTPGKGPCRDPAPAAPGASRTPPCGQLLPALLTLLTAEQGCCWHSSGLAAVPGRSPGWLRVWNGDSPSRAHGDRGWQAARVS